MKIINVGPKAEYFPQRNIIEFGGRSYPGLQELRIKFPVPERMFPELLQMFFAGEKVQAIFGTPGDEFIGEFYILDIQTGSPHIEGICSIVLTGAPRRYRGFNVGPVFFADPRDFEHKEMSVSIAARGLKATGPFTFTGNFGGPATPFAHPNCLCSGFDVNVPPMKEKPVKTTKTKVQNRFYVASDAMMKESEQGTKNTGEQVKYLDRDGYGNRPAKYRHSRWAKHTVDQAIAHATEILEQDPTKQEVAIVKIIKVVRRKPMPVVVEDVK